MGQNMAGKWGAYALALAALAAGCASSGMAADAPADAPAPSAGAAMAPTPELIAEGEQVFAGAGGCGICHGNNAAGGAFGPDLTDDDWAWIDPASPNAMAELADLIRTGVTEPRISDTGMPPMGGRTLTEEQLSALAAYILSL